MDDIEATELTLPPTILLTKRAQVDIGVKVKEPSLIRLKHKPGKPIVSSLDTRAFRAKPEVRKLAEDLQREDSQSQLAQNYKSSASVSFAAYSSQDPDAMTMCMSS